MGVTVRYSNLIHPQLVESVRTHQNSTFKLVKLGKGKLLFNVYLLLNCIFLLLVSDFTSEISDVYQHQSEQLQKIIQVKLKAFVLYHLKNPNPLMY